LVNAFFTLERETCQEKRQEGSTRKRNDDPARKAGLKEDYGYQQLKDFELRVFLTLQQRVKGER
jgi:hypothetical protein